MTLAANHWSPVDLPGNKHAGFSAQHFDQGAWWRSGEYSTFEEAREENARLAELDKRYSQPPARRRIVRFEYEEVE